MLVCGKNVAREVLNRNYNIKNIYLIDNFNNEEILSLIKKMHESYEYKTQSEMDKMTKELHQGIIIEIEDYEYLDFNSIRNDVNANFVLILDHIEDPRNFGAIIRTSECAGVDYIIIPNKRNVEVTSAVMKTSSGALANTKIVKVANLNNTITKLKELGYWIVGSDAEGTDYTKIDYRGKVALIIGSEGFGLKEMIRKNCDYIASIPLKGKVNSLNASVAAGILIYEIVKTR